MPSNIDTSPEDINQEKIAFYKSLLSYLVTRIGRNFLLNEKLALSFLVEKYWKSGESDPRKFSDSLFALNEADSPHEIVWKLCQFFYRLSIQECSDRAGSSDSEERERLLAIKGLYDLGQSQAELAHGNHTLRNIGGIPEYWLPDWIRDISV